MHACVCCMRVVCILVLYVCVCECVCIVVCIYASLYCMVSVHGHSASTAGKYGSSTPVDMYKSPEPHNRLLLISDVVD